METELSTASRLARVGLFGLVTTFLSHSGASSLLAACSARAPSFPIALLSTPAVPHHHSLGPSAPRTPLSSRKHSSDEQCKQSAVATAALPISTDVWGPNFSPTGQPSVNHDLAEQLIVSSAMSPAYTVSTLQRVGDYGANFPFDLRSPEVAVEVRAASAAELPLVVDLRAEVFNKADASYADWRLSSLKNLFQRRRKGATCLIATARKVADRSSKPILIGSVEFSHHEFTETSMSPCLSDDKSTAPKFYMTGVSVSPQFRRQGIALLLLQSVDQHALRLSSSLICMFVDQHNPVALSLYSKAGYNLVPYSPQAESFASAIGLYKGTYCNAQYAFVYKRLSSFKKQATARFGVMSSPSIPTFRVPTPAMVTTGGGSLLSDLSTPMKPFPAKIPSLRVAEARRFESTVFDARELCHERFLGIGVGAGDDVASRWD